MSDLRDSGSLSYQKRLATEVVQLRADLDTANDATEQIHQIRLSLIEENNRLRADLADARERLAAAYALIEEYDPDRTAQARALSAGGGGPDEGDRP